MTSYMKTTTYNADGSVTVMTPFGWKTWTKVELDAMKGNCADCGVEMPDATDVTVCRKCYFQGKDSGADFQMPEGW